MQIQVQVDRRHDYSKGIPAAASFCSWSRSWRFGDTGEAATSVSEVVWRWTFEPDSTWSLIERITPWTTCEASPERCREFEGALLASLDLPME